MFKFKISKHSFLLSGLLVINIITMSLMKIFFNTYDQFVANLILAFFSSIIQLILYFKIDNRYFFFQLPVVPIIVYFFISSIFPLTYYELFIDDIDIYYQYTVLSQNYYQYLTFVIQLTSVSSLLIGISYYSNLALKFSEYFKMKIKHLIPQKDTFVNKKVVLFLIIISLLSKFLAIKLGVFGFLGDDINLNPNIKYAQLLNFLGTLGFGALFFAWYLKFIKKSISIQIVFLAFLIELTFGFLSGMKNQVLKVALVPIIVSYIYNKRINPVYIVSAFLFFYLAFRIIEPMRLIRLTGANYNTQSISSYFHSLKKAVEIGDEFAKENTTTIWDWAVKRVDIASFSAGIISYSQNKTLNKESDPSFTSNMVLFPFYLYIPRAIWKNKPTFDYGVWTSRTVYEKYDTLSSSAVGIIGLLYISGGVFFIVFYMLIIGLIGKIFTTLFLFNDNILSKAIYLTIVYSFANLDILAIFNNFFRETPIILIIIFLIQKKNAKLII
jgi:hypothetical protein